MHFNGKTEFFIQNKIKYKINESAGKFRKSFVCVSFLGGKARRNEEGIKLLSKFEQQVSCLESF